MERIRKLISFGLNGIVILTVLGGLNCQAVEKSDTQQIQEQIDAVAKEGGVVNLDAKTYLLDKAVIIRSNVTFQGAGMDKTILRLKDNVNDAVIKIDFRFDGGKETISAPVNHDMVIKDLTIDGNAKNNLKSWFGGIALPYSYNYRVENVHIINCRGLGGIYTSAVQGREIYEQKNYILNNIVEGCVKGKNPEWEGMRYGHGIYLTSRFNKNILVKGNIARNNEAGGIFLEDKVQYVFVEHNEVYDNQDEGIWVNETKNSSIRFNKIYNNKGRGISIGGGDPDYNKNNIFYGNEVYGNGYEGILFVLSGDQSFPTYCLIVGNKVWNNRNIGIVVYGPQYNNISFNLCYDDREQKTQKFGIRISSANNTIVNNYLKGNAESEIDLVKGNTYVPYDYEKGWDPSRLVGKF